MHQAVGVVTSPGYPEAYPHNANCTWYIVVNPGESHSNSGTKGHLKRTRTSCISFKTPWSQLQEQSSASTPENRAHSCEAYTQPILPRSLVGTGHQIVPTTGHKESGTHGHIAGETFCG